MNNTSQVQAAKHSIGGRLPSFVIIGAQKAGTTSLGAYLDAHPDASCAMEPHFFCCHYERGVDWYRGQFTSGAIAVGEKTPDYLDSPEAPERMARTLPDAQLIAILRDPVARAYSHYWHRRRVGREHRSFEDALADPAETREAGYIGRGRYLSHLLRFLDFFPRDSLEVVLFEDLRDNPVATFSEVCRFLGLNDALAPAELGRTENPYRIYRPAWLWRSMYRYRLWRRLPARWASTLGSWMTHEVPYTPLRDETRASLAERYAPENEALAQWLGRDLDAWTKPAAQT